MSETQKMYELIVTRESDNAKTASQGSNRAMLRDYLVAATGRAGLDVINVVEGQRDKGVIWQGSSAYGLFEIREVGTAN